MTPRKLKLGDTAKSADTVKPIRFAGKTGLVKAINRIDNEIGLELNGSIIYFRPTELTLVS